jgi:hypothetical protein
MCCIEGSEDNKGRTQCGPLHLGGLLNGPIKGSTVEQNVVQFGNWQVRAAYGRNGVTACGRLRWTPLADGTSRTYGTYRPYRSHPVAKAARLRPYAGTPLRRYALELLELLSLLP